MHCYSLEDLIEEMSNNSVAVIYNDECARIFMALERTIDKWLRR